MVKKFAISLIIISTFVYGSIFFNSKQYGTSFFDEIIIQVNRLAASLSQSQEASQSKIILKTILENEHPPNFWKTLITRSKKNDHNALFYYYKVWTIKTKLNHNDIKGAYSIFQSKNENHTIINMRYGKTKPVLQFSFFKDKEGRLIAGLFFPINEPPFSADYNKDSMVNYKDVLLARKAE